VAVVDDDDNVADGRPDPCCSLLSRLMNDDELSYYRSLLQ
jgi:hypothetical protein